MRERFNEERKIFSIVTKESLSHFSLNNRSVSVSCSANYRYVKLWRYKKTSSDDVVEEVTKQQKCEGCLKMSLRGTLGFNHTMDYLFTVTNKFNLEAITF